MIQIESFYQPKNLKEALSLLDSLQNPKILAGGTDLISQLHRDDHIEQLRQRIPKQWMLNPIQLIDISQINNLKIFKIKNNSCTVGSLFTHSEISQNVWIKENLPFLHEASSLVGSPQIRNQGTIGGNICNASPCADTVPPLVCSGSEILLENSTGERKVPLLSFFVDAQKSIIEKNEILTEIRLKIPSKNNIQFFKKLGQRKGIAIAKLNLAFYANLENCVFKDVRIAMGAVGPTVIFAKKTSQFLKDKKLSVRIINEAKIICCSEAKPIDDIRSTKEYRATMVGELLEMGLKEFLA